jgi:DHA1 family bicyclomycin/chloramphenicol resistance-like MFS transporter
VIDKSKLSIPLLEFVALMALVFSVVALATDAMLPALAEIGQELGAGHANDAQLIISLFFLGIVFGQAFFGPFSDSRGRKPAIYAGFAVFSIGCLVSIFSTTFSGMLAGRFLQGLGAAGPRVVVVALIRDQFQGRDMARVMSFIISIFILVPIVAPAMGQVLLIVADWRAIFYAFLLLTVVSLTWFSFRQEETLAPENRIPFSPVRVAGRVREIGGTRVTMGYTIITGLMSGCFIGYLNTSQQILQLQYGLGKMFPLYFAILAFFFGLATLLNSRLVVRFGMQLLTGTALVGLVVISVIYLPFSWMLAGQPPLWTLMSYLMLCFFSVGMLFGNLNALAMEPLGHVAGTGSAFVGSVSTLIAVAAGSLIGQSYNGTILPLVTGFAVLSLLSLFVMRWAEAGR